MHVLSGVVGLRGANAAGLGSCPRFWRRARFWSWRRDLNPRPSDYKSDALPTELRQHSTGAEIRRGAAGGAAGSIISWSGRRESNPQPTAWKAVTLPLSYSRPSACQHYCTGGGPTRQAAAARRRALRGQNALFCLKFQHFARLTSGSRSAKISKVLIYQRFVGDGSKRLRVELAPRERSLEIFVCRGPFPARCTEDSPASRPPIDWLLRRLGHGQQ